MNSFKHFGYGCEPSKYVDGIDLTDKKQLINFYHIVLGLRPSKKEIMKSLTRVRAHPRREKSGKVAQVRSHERLTKRGKPKPARQPTIRFGSKSHKLQQYIPANIEEAQPFWGWQFSRWYLKLPNGKLVRGLPEGVSQPALQFKTEEQAQRMKEKLVKIKRSTVAGELPAKLAKKIRRRDKGQGREVKLSTEELKLVLSTGKYALISAGRNPEDPEDVKLTDKQIVARHRQLKDDLKDSGYAYTGVVGHYGEEEQSFSP